MTYNIRLGRSGTPDRGTAGGRRRRRRSRQMDLCPPGDGSDRLASCLIRRGVQPGQPVGVVARRSAAVVALFLAVPKSLLAFMSRWTRTGSWKSSHMSAPMPGCSWFWTRKRPAHCRTASPPWSAARRNGRPWQTLPPLPPSPPACVRRTRSTSSIPPAPPAYPRAF